jgi:hypothetical protein
MSKATFPPEWYQSYEARNIPEHRRGPVPADPGPEDVLHGKIAGECKRRGWRTVHSRMDMPSTVGEGTCDFIIYADKGRMFHIECKASNGKLSMEQRIFIAWVAKLGHSVHVVDSFQQFLEIISL